MYAHYDRATAVLETILKGRSICGIHFYASPILLFDDHERGHPHEAWLTIGSAWSNSAVEIWDGDHSLERLVAFAASCRHRRIRSIALGTAAPHLLLTFDNGSHLHVNGSHALYESWNLACGDISVVAIPGERIAVFE